MSEGKRSRGRPRKEPEDGERYPVTARLTSSVRKRLEESANRNRRSLAQEVEYRLERSFSDDDKLGDIVQSHFLRTMREVMQRASRAFDGPWWNDEDAWNLVRAAADYLFEDLRPDFSLFGGRKKASEAVAAYLKEYRAWHERHQILLRREVEFELKSSLGEMSEEERAEMVDLQEKLWADPFDGPAAPPVSEEDAAILEDQIKREAMKSRAFSTIAAILPTSRMV